ncbi:MAG: leucine-rich repeat domain-containing protein, partial [Clostridia bacterium]|nr:leucine-rich repeat domain-containing protein [Clostridia bacterium]
GDIIPCTDLDFELSSDGTYYIIKGIGTFEGSNLLLPSEHNGKPVKEIAAEAFKNNKTLKKVVIPEGITKVGDHAFSNCSVEEAEINTANAELGIYLFEKSGIKKLTLHNDIKIIPAGIFYQCGGIKEFTIGENIEEIHNNAFAYTAIEKLTIPGNVKIVGYRAFYYCEELKELTICEGVTQIISQAFFGCFRYVDPECIVLPDSLTVLDREAFRSCGYITELVIGDGLEEISARAFFGCDIDKVVIGKKVNKIGEDAFTSTDCNYHIESMEQWNAIKNYNQVMMGAFGYALYVNGEKVYSSY